VIDTELNHGDSIVFAGAYAGNGSIGVEVGDAIDSRRLGSKYFYRFVIEGYGK
jgi:hypothetical protein|tara:strand:+ start:149 stop:307 length:159 start_codon:yes stop_codon:yes gene_type:complete